MIHVINLNKTDTTYRNEALERWIGMIRPYKVLSVDEEEEAIRKYKSGDDKALEDIIKGHQRFLLACARTYSRYGDEILDLISEGNIALLRAAQNFDPEYGVKFISFAVHYIKRYMLAYFDQKGLVDHRINATVEAFVKETKETYLSENGFEIPDWQLNEIVGEKFERDFKQGGSYFRKVNVYFNDDIVPDDYDGDSVIDKITAVENDAVSELELEGLRVLSKTFIDNVCQSQTEKDVIIYGYGLFDEPQLSDYEIAVKCGLEEWQVGYLRNKIIGRMRLFAHGKTIRLNKSKHQSYVGKGEVKNSRSDSGNRVSKPNKHNIGKSVRRAKRRS